VAAFRLAAELGADGVELDVRITADGVAVVHHDPRLADGRPVVAVRRSELPDHVPTLEEALDACPGIQVIVEIKNHRREPGYDRERRAGPAVAAVLARRGLTDRTTISSFDLGTVDAAAASGHHVATAWLVGLGIRRNLLDRCRRRGHGAIHPIHSLVSAAFVAAAHARGLQVVAWTVDEPARIRRLAGWGVDGIITNDVEGALAALDPATFDPATFDPAAVDPAAGDPADPGTPGPPS
jgi:glycerophosphoryl diester phosphodiesterase